MECAPVASWGPAEYRPLRDQMRALLIGRAFMTVYRAAEGDRWFQDSWWVDWVRNNTALGFRWIWGSTRAFTEEYGELYALIAGDLILSETAKAKIVSDRWFKTDISKNYGWLFEPACLRYDGWTLVDCWNQKGETFKTWARTKPVVVLKVSRAR